jgi:hypothetical protein
MPIAKLNFTSMYAFLSQIISRIHYHSVFATSFSQRITFTKYF